MIKLCEPYVDAAEQEAATRVLASGALARGEEVQNFEANFSAVVGRHEAVAAANGTCALHLAVRAAGWKAGDEVITSAYSFIATPNTLQYEGVRPVFAPVGSDLQMDLNFVSDMLKRGRGIVGLLIPHMFGKEVDVEGLAAIKETHPELRIIEDAAQALAPRDYGLGVGKVGDMAAYSFHENKVITTAGEGGAITTDNPAMAARMRSLREQGKLTSSRWMDDIGLGYNYRMTELQAAIGTVQLTKLPRALATRRHLAEVYANKLDRHAALSIPMVSERRSWFGFYIEAADDPTASAVRTALRDNHIEHRSNPFPPLPMFNHLRAFEASGVDVPALAARASRIIMLPLHPSLSEESVSAICEAVNDAAA